jgi:gamma-glutamyltranspeptidase/glutathione hydrolase
MLQSIRLGFLAVLSLLLIVTYLPKANTSPLEFAQRDHNTDHASHTRIAPGKLGAVASESAICSQHGVDILKMGGNAADAVSILFCVRESSWRVSMLT